ncbi:MAG: Asp23/Gls24 family envelope stress response protein [Actinobacteria bacterium]|nr:Asp23/Gls24 family envelope stress response protein [Actinomycetota bacterium]
MSESEASSRTTAGDEQRSRSQGDGGGALQSEHGQTTIGEGVVTKVAGIAAREVPGVHDLGGGAERALGSMSQKAGMGENRGQGVSVETGEKEAAVDLSLVIDYGESIPRIAEAVRNQVIKRVEGITGLTVTEVNIVVNDLYFPGDHESQEESRVS